VSLRSRTFLVVAATFVVAGGLLFLAVREATLRGFRGIEEQDAVRDMERALSALDYDVSSVRSHALDYAEWDDTWLFCRGENPRYFGSGLTDSTFKSQHIDAIAITNAADALVLAKTYDADEGEFGDLPPSLAALGPGHPLLLHHRKERGEIAGYWLDPEMGPMILCALPIVRSDKSGEFAGTLVFARYLDAGVVRAFGERTRLCLSLRPGSAAVPAGAREPEGVAPSRRVLLGEPREDGLAVVGFLPFLNSTEPLVAHVEVLRPAMAEANRVLRLVLVAVAILFTITVGAVLLAVNRLVLAPLERVGAAVEGIGRSGSTDVRVPAEGHDEWATLARRFNDMLSAIEASRAALADAAAEADRANRSKSAFLAAMSHEIRTPMNGILGMIEMALDRTEDPERREVLLTAKGSAEGLLLLLNDILDLSRVEAGRLDLDRAPFPLRDALRDAALAFRYRAREKEIALDVRVDGEVPAWAWGDGLRLRQVVTNLVGNAVKFTESGGVYVTASAGPPGADGRVPVRVEVRDTGIGIPEDRRARIFEEFGQADASVALRFGGSGLGLAISSRLVALMGGRIGVESSTGLGSAFSFTVAWEPASPPVPGPEGAPFADRPVRPLTVLVADDSPVNLRVVTYFLRRRGHAVVSVGDGRAAVGRAAEGGVDVILMDVHMPEMDGIEATRAIRAAESGGRRVPIVALTASVMKEDTALCLQAGMDAVVMKPINSAELLRVVESFGAAAPAWV